MRVAWFFLGLVSGGFFIRVMAPSLWADVLLLISGIWAAVWGVSLAFPCRACGGSECLSCTVLAYRVGVYLLAGIASVAAVWHAAAGGA
jgi:hypothetical protein